MDNQNKITDKSQLLREAKQLFGKEVVEEVLGLVQVVGDIDSIYTELLDTNMDDHVECLEFLFLDKE